MNEKEPWRIDRNSVHFKVLKGWLSKRFKEWLVRAATQYKLSEDELLIKIIETIRKISWRTFQILKQRTGKEVDMPIIIVVGNPWEILVLESVIEEKGISDFLCDESAMLATIENLDSAITSYVGRQLLEQVLSEFLGKGPIVGGAAAEHGVAIYDREAMNLFEAFEQSKGRFLEIVIEEAFHYFCAQTGKFHEQEMRVEMREKVRNLDIREQNRLGQAIEEKYGVKKMVAELLQILKQKEDELFSLLPLNK